MHINIYKLLNLRMQVTVLPACHKGRLEPTNLDDTLQVRTYYRIRNCETKA